MAAGNNNIASSGCGIVSEPLRKDNYENWSTLVETYLVGKDLWHGILDVDIYRESEVREDSAWRSRNAKALHAIQLACGPENLPKIKAFKRARDAWNFLKVYFGEDARARARPYPDGTGTGTEYHQDQRRQGEYQYYVHKLHNSVKRGYWNDAKSYLNEVPDAIFSTTPSTGRTVLHIAVAYEHEKIVKELVNMGNPRLLTMQDKKGYTPLALAAELTDNTNMAEWMIYKGGNNGMELLNIKTKEDIDNDGEGEIPVLLASAKGHKQMTRYLFNLTSTEVLLKNNGHYGVKLLTRCISAKIFDVAAYLLQNRSNRESPLLQKNYGLRPIHALSRMPSAFRSGTQLGWWRRFVYNSWSLPTHIDVSGQSVEIVLHEVPDENSDTNALPIFFATHPLGIIFSSVASVLVPVKQLYPFFGQIKLALQTSLLPMLPGSRKIYEMKMDHYLVLEILKWLSQGISELDESQLREYATYDTMLQAVKYGITEFIESMCQANPDLLWVTDKHKRDIFAHAILNRQEKVFQLIHKIQGRKEMIASREDVFGNNLLHLSAQLGPSSYLRSISNSALQMQRELQWFKTVEKIVPSNYKEARNHDGKTPIELFTENHEELMKAGEKWARDTASSFTVVGTLIITIMFAAAFTVPGGNDQNTGIPIFLKRPAFRIFIIADTISLVMSSSSVLIFIGVLTSRYAEKDFLRSLHYKILLGLITLFFSVTSMMLAFVAALSLMMKGYRGVVIAAISLAIIPIVVLVVTLWSLSYEILKSTWRQDLLTIKKKKDQD